MKQEKFSFTSQTYSDRLRSMMKNLLSTNEFSDVTLVTEDKKYLPGHKNILSASSPFFRDIFHEEKSSHPIIYLRGINSLDVESIMQFIYLGEATLNKERIDEFLAVTKSLEIIELCDAEIETINDQEVTFSTSTNDPLTSDVKLEVQTIQNNQDKSVQNYQESFENQTQKEVSFHGANKYFCDYCDFQAPLKKYLTRHIRSEHLACNKCDYQAKNKHHLFRHTQNKHDHVKYRCDYCEYQASQRDNLKEHIQRKHDSVKYNCSQCDYQGNHQIDLKRHIQSKHTESKQF